MAAAISNSASRRGNMQVFGSDRSNHDDLRQHTSLPADLIRHLVRVVALPILAVILIFNIRRILFSIVTLRARGATAGRERKPDDPEDLPNVLILVPCRDEAEVIPGLVEGLRALDYPCEKQRIVFIDDGSRDGTLAAMQDATLGRPGWDVLALPMNAGKANALNRALAQFSWGEIIYVMDADHRPQPDVLRKAAQYFEARDIAAITGRTLPLNPLASPSAYYCTVESYVNQMVTMRAKDRLHLAPALLGSNCAYRRSALAECGGFRGDALSEDSDLTITFHCAGYRVRFAEDVISYQQMPQTVAGYFKQHVRWGRGLNDVAKTHVPALARNANLSLPLKLELMLFSAGYLDRLALLGAAALTVLGAVNGRICQFPSAVLGFALFTPFGQIVALFAEQRVSRAMWLRLPLVPLFFALDIFAAVRAALDSISGRARTWTQTARLTM
jgi:cellulose synthase/poly-beta-1,6-N-acetylglucosamine synthase-like glycosyltransferase